MAGDCVCIIIDQTQGDAYTYSGFQFLKELLELLCKIYQSLINFTYGT